MTIEEKLIENIKSIGNNEYKYEPHKYHVTELLYCIKKPILNRLLPDVRTEPNTNMIIGSIFHKVLPYITRDIKEFEGAEYEKPLSIEYKGVNIVGKADVVTDEYIYEFKFTSNVLDSYKRQANIYACLNETSKYKVISFIKSKNKYKNDIKIDIYKGETDKTECYAFLEIAVLIDTILNSDINIEKLNSYKLKPVYNFECYGCVFKEFCKQK